VPVLLYGKEKRTYKTENRNFVLFGNKSLKVFGKQSITRPVSTGGYSLIISKLIAMESILLIDDDADDCLFFRKALAAVSNYIVLCWKQDVDHLLETIDSSKPCLIFIDYYMPKRCGIDLLKQIKNHPVYNQIPVIIWSTSLLPNNVIEAYREGAQAFIQKPCTCQQLVQELSAILKQHGIWSQPINIY
jgi:CheY-like chemotaxis protein